jgi:hypothetical protein
MVMELAMVEVMPFTEEMADTLAVLEITVAALLLVVTTGEPLVLQPVEPLHRDGRALSSMDNPLG